MQTVSTSLISSLAAVMVWAGAARALEPESIEPESAIRTWHKGHGLLADSVTAIIQTRDGFLWVGTSEGVERFDGVKFTTVPLGQSAAQTPVWVTALCEDSRGYVWIGTQQDGLFKLEQGRVRHYTRASGLLDDNVTSLAADSQGLVWIGTRSGLNVHSDRGFKAFTIGNGLRDQLVSGIHVARSGTIWITTRRGMCQFVEGRIVAYPLQTDSSGRSPEYLGVYEDRRRNQWAYGDTYLVNLGGGGKRFNYFRGNEAVSIRTLCEGRDGRLWIGTSGRGLICFDNDRFQPVILDKLRGPHDVRAICEDREGNLWLGTKAGGLIQLRPQPVQVLKTGSLSDSPTALATDAHGRVFVGLARAGIFVAESGRFERFGGGEGLAVQDFVSSLAVSRDDAVWAGTLGSGLYVFRNGRGVRFTTGNGLADDSVRSVCVDVEGQVWAATGAGTLHRFTEQTVARYDLGEKLIDSPVSVIAPAHSGGIWLGTDHGWIARGERGEFVVRHRAEPAARRPVLALHEGEAGRLWIGMAGGGLACLSKNATASWTTATGLPNDTVAAVIEDPAHNLWLATEAGVYRVSSNAVHQALKHPTAGLGCKLVARAPVGLEPSMPFGNARALSASDGRLWFATSEGVLTVDNRSPEIVAGPLPIHIESVSFNGKPPILALRNVAWAGGPSNDLAAVVPRDLRSLEVQFTALGFSDPEQIHFRHKLEGFDVDWIEDGTARSNRYNGPLPYGRYRFRVAARQAQGEWQEAAVGFAFIVPTPLYLQPWAILLSVVAAVGSVAGVVRVVSHRRLRRALAKLEQQQTLERERMRIARDMHDEIGSKLTKLSFLSEHAKMDAKSNEPVSGKLEAIAETSRDLLQTMDEIVWVVNPRNDSLEHLAAYLSHYASEYFQNTRIECDIRLPRSIPDHPLSSEARHNLFLAFEEALNNVLKHASASKVRIDMALAEPAFEISVVDDGRGFRTPVVDAALAAPVQVGSWTGNGLRNMRQRLADIGGECLVRSQPGAGTAVTMRILLNHQFTHA